jgi:hypothetical protein
MQNRKLESTLPAFKFSTCYHQWPPRWEAGNYLPQLWHHSVSRAEISVARNFQNNPTSSELIFMKTGMYHAP